jgi:hypothetical protein
MLVETSQIKSTLVSNLMKEGEEILAIVVASAKTARVKNNPKSAIANPQ